MKIIDGWIDEAIEVNVMGSSMSRNGYRPTHLVMHGTAGGTSAVGIGNYFKSKEGDPVNGASSHIVIDQAGNIVQCVSFLVAAWGNAPLNAPRISFANASANPNFWTISIEHCKASTDNSNELTAAQKAASFKVAKLICETYGIPKRYGDGNGGVIAHADINSIDRSRCPGPYPWDELFKYLNSEGDDMAQVRISVGIGSRFEDKGGGRWLLKGSNPAIYLGGHMRQAFCYYEGIFGLPTDNEIKLDSDGATVQPFERVLAVFDPKHKYDNPPRTEGSGAPSDIYLMHIDSGDGQKRVAKPLTDALNKQIASQKTQIDTLNHQLSTVENQEKEALQAQIQDLTAKQTKLINIVNQFVAEATALS